MRQCLAVFPTILHSFYKNDRFLLLLSTLYTIENQSMLVSNLFNRYFQILIDKHRRARGVIFDRLGKTFTVHAKREVIISAGAINSPQLLMLSGIGPKNQLRKFGVKTPNYSDTDNLYILKNVEN